MNSNSQTCGCDNGLIDISGLCDPDNTTAVISQYPYWKQMYLSESLLIPPQKPDAEQINAIVASVSILKKTVIATPRSFNDTGTVPVAVPNLEGKLLTGRKLIIEGQLCQQVEYTANELTQPIHSVEFFVPFSSYIVIPETVILNADSIPTAYDTLDVDFEVNVCLEDINACLLDERSILLRITMLLNAVPLGAD